MSIWVTRSAPDNLATARRIHALGSTPVLVPVLDVAPIAHAPLAKRPDAIIFSSKHAVRHHQPPADFVSIPVHAASEGVAQAAREMGYRDVSWAGGDDRVLCDSLRWLLPDDAQVAYFCSERTSSFVEERLAAHGATVTRIVVYAAARLDVQPALATTHGVRGILVHSTNAAIAIRPLIVSRGWQGTVWCISAAAAAVLAGLPGVRLSVARQPTEASLLGLVRRDTGGTPPPPRSLRKATPANDN